jgi:RHS repeat-associated protein
MALASERRSNSGQADAGGRGINRISMTDATANDFFYAYDGTDSVTNLASTSGNTEWTYTYNPFGGVRAATGGDLQPANSMKFDGLRTDPAIAGTSVYDSGARAYDSSQGRFLQQDSLGAAAIDSSGSSYSVAQPAVVDSTEKTCKDTAEGLQDTVVKLAYKEIGVPYVWGGDSPSGFDCSGLVKWIWGNIGASLAHSTYVQDGYGSPVSSVSQLVPGDLVFFSSDSHVGIYVGGGYMIDAPHTGAFVRKEPLFSGISAMRHLIRCKNGKLLKY